MGIELLTDGSNRFDLNDPYSDQVSLVHSEFLKTCPTYSSLLDREVA